MRKWEYVYLFQPQADHYGSKTPFRDFRCLGTYIAEKGWPKKHLISKFAIDKTQIFVAWDYDRSSPKKPYPNSKPSQKWEPGPEVIFKHDELYDRAWEFEYEKRTLYNDQNELNLPNSRGVPTK